MSTTLARPHDDRILAGVCAAIGRRFDIGSLPIRALTVIVSLPFFWLAPFVYVALWILIPEQPRR
ncbi:phage shock protein PspC (stress-responsive transcriptional regulator) [Microbacterium terrae]|uniref:PspC domain protein n=1 Tax=Microbacterium terrae TaxID=69369 RepID=A0A0M2H4W3_9MICO|nr:PspC domain-containing protein [Microbacterium terrae]KJL39538.1 PspC domain protein [Microbacterium terrae]MBP1078130.1 phage shock protein PspC (stress-responsive transcriptional regulator) [Microbacterium terrae]